jgi:hypothetical protein
VPTAWDARIQFTGLPTLHWLSARHYIIRWAVNERLKELRRTPLLFASNALYSLRCLYSVEDAALVRSYWRKARIQPYVPDGRQPTQRIMCQLRNPEVLMPLYRTADKFAFVVQTSVCDDCVNVIIGSDNEDEDEGPPRTPAVRTPAF